MLLLRRNSQKDRNRVLLSGKKASVYEAGVRLEIYFLHIYEGRKKLLLRAIESSNVPAPPTTNTTYAEISP